MILKNSKITILAVLGLIGLSVLVKFSFTLESVEEQINIPDSSRQRVNKADKPQLYAAHLKELRTKDGEVSPGYPPGYQFKALKIAANQSANLRLENTYEFIERGPGNVPGRTRGLVVDPGDPDHKTWFAGSVGGGIWKTTDGGQSWINKTPNLSNLAISWIVIAESDPTIMYAGTGEGWGSNSTFIKGNGVLKTTNRGDDWFLLESTTESLEFEMVNRLIVDPNNADVVLAATNNDRSGGLEFNSQIMKSTDGGLSWTKKYSAEPITYVQQIISDPNDFNIQYASIRGVGVIKSIDAGETWFNSSSGLLPLGRIELAISPLVPSRLFASAEGDLTGTGSDLYISNDSGETWTVTVNGSGDNIDFLGGQGWYDNTVLAHPFNANQVYVAGVNLWKVNVGNNIIEQEKRFRGIEFIPDSSFIALVSFDSENGTVSLGEESPEDFVTVEVRFGRNENGDPLTQMAHRFTVPNGRGSGVEDPDYSYEDYVEVPFQVWDKANNRQLMVSFRDQQKDNTFDLLKENFENETWQDNSREYIFISNIEYNSAGPDQNIARQGGHKFKNLYFFWPYLKENATWDPENLINSVIRFKYESSIGYSSIITSVTDAYNQYEGTNRFRQTTGSTTTEGVHPDHHNIVPVVHNNANRTFQLLLANDGGLYSSNIGVDPGVLDNSWTFAGKGYNTSQFYAVDKAPDQSRYIGGLQDNGTWMSLAGQEGSATATYKRATSGDGFGTAWNHRDKNKILTTLYYNRIEKSTNQGLSFQSSNQGLRDAGSGLAPFITELENNHSNPDVVFTTGISGVWRSLDFGDSWELAEIQNNWGGASFIPVEISDANSNIIWAGAFMSNLNDFSLHVSTDGGKSFNPAKNYQGETLGRVSEIVSHPLLDSTAFAMFSFAKTSKILRTDDLGQSWYDVSGFIDGESTKGFPDVAVNAFLVMPNDTSVFWAGTEIGIFESTDSGNNWHPLAGNFPAVSVWDIKIVDKEVVIGTHGRGIWSIELEDLEEHIYLPEILTAYPTLNGALVLDFNLGTEFDSLLVFVNDKRLEKITENLITGTNTIVMNYNGVNSANAYIRAYKNTRPFVSPIFNFELSVYNGPIDSYQNNFDTPRDDFFGYGFNVGPYSNFDGNAIHTIHPYAKDSRYQYVLKHRIRVKSSEAYINFLETVIVEIGEPESTQGSKEFKDYVVVQGSLDGLNWTNLVGEYDSNDNPLWQKIYSFNTPGDKKYYRFRAIDLLETFEPNDEIIIRFVLQSDSDEEAWGWAIDNLNIQTEFVIADLEENIERSTSYEVYPNPVLGNSFKLSSKLNGNKINLLIYNQQGAIVLQKSILSSNSQNIDLPQSLKNGIYLLVIEGDQTFETHKIAINR